MNLPRGWSCVELSSLIVDGPTNGYSGATGLDAKGSPTLRLSATSQGRLVLNDSTVKQLYETISPDSPLWLSPDDLLVQRSNTLDLVGTAAVYDGSPGAYVYPDLMMRIRFSCRETTRWVWRYMNSPQGRAFFKRVAAGSSGSMPKISGAKLRQMPIPFPPVKERQRISDLLDQTEALRAKRRAALTQLDSLTQAMFLDMFVGTEDPKWSWATIADVAHKNPGSIRTGPFGSQLLQSEFVNDGVAVLGIDNVVANEFRWGERRFISDAKYRELKRYTVFPGDVLITIMGTCGRCAVVPQTIPVAVNTKHLCCITPDPEKCLPAFLHAYFLLHPLARRYLNQTAKGAIMNGLNMGLIKAMPIPMPPLKLQSDFARRVAAVEKLKAAQHASLAELDALFASLQHRAFRGEL